MGEPIDVRTLSRPQVRRLAFVLADAFRDDPVYRWLFGERASRARLARSFEGFIRILYAPLGYSYTTSDLEGAALWSPPGRWRISLVAQARLAPSQLRSIGLRRALHALPAFRALERHHPSDAHFHLAILGVDPPRQRQGVGASLMRPVLDLADRMRTLCYLETARIDNVAYYERHGFEVSAQLDLPPDGPHLWTMTRRPL